MLENLSTIDQLLANPNVLIRIASNQVALSHIVLYSEPTTTLAIPSFVHYGVQQGVSEIGKLVKSEFRAIIAAIPQINLSYPTWQMIGTDWERSNKVLIKASEPYRNLKVERSNIEIREAGHGDSNHLLVGLYTPGQVDVESEELEPAKTSEINSFKTIALGMAAVPFQWTIPNGPKSLIVNAQIVVTVEYGIANTREEIRGRVKTTHGRVFPEDVMETIQVRNNSSRMRAYVLLAAGMANPFLGGSPGSGKGS